MSPARTLCASFALLMAGIAALADPVTLDQKPFTCADADTICKDNIAQFTRLHWEKHILEAELAIEVARLEKQTKIKEVAVQLAAAEESLRAAAEKSRMAAEERRNEQLINLAKNAPGLVLRSAVVASGDQTPISCDALPYARYHCAIDTSCAESDTQKCPDKFTCQLKLQETGMCYLPSNARPPYELTVSYLCNGVLQPAITVSTRATETFLACDLRQ